MKEEKRTEINHDIGQLLNFMKTETILLSPNRIIYT